MPIPIIIKGFQEGVDSIPLAWSALHIAPWVLILAALKYYFGGARNTSERLMHSKVVMVTVRFFPPLISTNTNSFPQGGTSGIGANVVQELASRGAQVILLTRQPPSDLFLVEYIDDLRRTTGSNLIYAEQVDLTSLHSIRTFATKWIDNAPPRRLDAVILCGGIALPSHARTQTTDGIDEEWQVNYLANFHLLSILSPALRVQPAHRDVRVIFTTCSSYIGAKFELDTVKRGVASKKNAAQTKNIYAMSKFALMAFAQSFQRHLTAYQRPDGLPNCTRVIVVDPGASRTPGMRRWLTGGSLWGLLLYLLTWPIWWLFLKSPQQGAQSILYAAMEEKYGRGQGGWMIKECREVDFARRDIQDEDVGKRLWEFSEKQIEEAEKEGAVKRALEKKEKEAEKEKKTRKEASSGKTQSAGSRRNRKNKT